MQRSPSTCARHKPSSSHFGSQLLEKANRPPSMIRAVLLISLRMQSLVKPAFPADPGRCVIHLPSLYATSRR